MGGAKGASRLIVERDGETLWPRLKDKRDIQKALTELLGFSHNLFINSIVFPQKVTRFIESKGPERKKIFDEAFKMLWVNKAATLASKKRQDLHLRRTGVAGELLGKETSLDSLEDILETMVKAASDFETDKASNLARINQNIETLEAESQGKAKQVQPILNREQGLLRDRDRVETSPLYLKRNQLSIDLNVKLPERNRIQRELRENEAALTKALSSKIVNCSKCNQPLPKKDSKTYIQSLRDTKGELQSKLLEVKPVIESLSQDLIDADKLGGELRDTREDLTSIQKELTAARKINLTIEGAKGRLEEMRKQVSELEASKHKDLSAPVKNKVFIVEKELKKLEGVKSKLDKKISTYDWLISGPLGPNGIKSFMFTRLVELVNYQLLVLEKFTGWGVALSVEGSGVRKNIEAIVSRRGFPVAYVDLSGGEGNLVNVMISLAIGEVVTSEQPVNIRIFDESFEGLDTENVEVVANLLSQIKADTSLFVITHKDEFNPQNCNRIRLTNDE